MLRVRPRVGQRPPRPQPHLLEIDRVERGLARASINIGDDLGRRQGVRLLLGRRGRERHGHDGSDRRRPRRARGLPQSPIIRLRECVQPQIREVAVVLVLHHLRLRFHDWRRRHGLDRFDTYSQRIFVAHEPQFGHEPAECLGPLRPREPPLAGDRRPARAEPARERSRGVHLVVLHRSARPPRGRDGRPQKRLVEREQRHALRRGLGGVNHQRPRVLDAVEGQEGQACAALHAHALGLADVRQLRGHAVQDGAEAWPARPRRVLRPVLLRRHDASRLCPSKPRERRVWAARFVLLRRANQQTKL
mmetsp:Transcript_22239/g.62585  ORF Transcript_22239/g.62585 Transcript_22239/m.62585 type:complete len:305 (+) Transcript_22239:1255-2169(+)